MWGRKDEQTDKDDGIAWWLKFLARAVGTVGGIGAVLLGIWACVSLSASCIGAGIVQMTAGFIVVIFEAPCCCQFLDFISTISQFSDRRPHWQKAVMYFLLAIPSVAMCPEVSTILGGGCIFVTGTLYGLMALGKKGDADSMRLAAARSDGMEKGFVKQEVPLAATTNMPV